MDLYFILFLISLGLNIVLFLFLIFKKKPIQLEFENVLYILDTMISTEKEALDRGLSVLRRKYCILGANGKITPPNDRIEEYRNKKKELKEKITKRVIRQLSKELIGVLLLYFSEHGLASYIITELDKDSAQPIVGGLPK